MNNEQWLDEAKRCYPGWWPIIEKLDAQLNYLMPDGYTIYQIKEKFGTLRFYCGFKDEPIVCGIARACVSDAENLSASTCEECGEWGKLRDDLGWMRTLCKTHYGEALERRLKAIDPSKLLTCGDCGEPAVLYSIWGNLTCHKCYVTVPTE